MKEMIYTIPVNDAYAAGGACPLCSLERNLDQNLLDFFLGPSLMEPDVRKVTNAKGFCRRHLAELYNREDNRLGLGLILHTHLADLIADLNPRLAHAAPVSQNRLFGGGGDFKSHLLALAARIDQRVASCAICERMELTMDHYLDVIFYQYTTDSSFKGQFDDGGGYCLPHTSLLVGGAARYLNREQAGEFIRHLAQIQNKSLETLHDDVEWYTLKYDYRNQQKDWKNSKDALIRAIRKIGGDIDLKDKPGGAAQ
jgi:hypothetical protein